MNKGEKTTAVGGLVTAFFASLCCIGPLVFAALGVGVGATGFLADTAGVLKGLLPYRPVFIVLMVLLLGRSLYLAYRKPRAFCTWGAMCAPRADSRVNRALLWSIAIFAIVLVLAPYWLEILTR
ncbi:MAG TPA: mercuric transporter MerT family protein [Nitrospira sp.]|nr:mercuric transporter MerT family protein [Nitrospira sp.]